MQKWHSAHQLTPFSISAQQSENLAENLVRYLPRIIWNHLSEHRQITPEHFIQMISKRDGS